MATRFRLLPVVIVSASLVFVVRMSDLWFDVTAHAATDGGAGKATTTATSPAPAAGGALPTLPASATPQSMDAKAAAAAAQDPMLMSPSEIDVLQKLSQRRTALDKRAADISQQEVLLKAAEQRIDDKIAKLQTIQNDIGGLVDKQDQQEDQRLKGLVKIYETMKPAEAARIFDQLDMPLVVDVLQRMKQAKAAPVLAAMDPEKAKTATTALAERKKPGENNRASSTTP